MPGHAWWHSAVSCAKMAEPIEMVSGLWTRVRVRKHVLGGLPPDKYHWTLYVLQQCDCDLFIKLLWPPVVIMVAHETPSRTRQQGLGVGSSTWQVAAGYHCSHIQRQGIKVGLQELPWDYLLSVSGKVFAHIILTCIKSTLLACRWSEQSWFTPNCSTSDRILTLCNLAQRRLELSIPTHSAYMDLHAAFDS